MNKITPYEKPDSIETQRFPDGVGFGIAGNVFAMHGAAVLLSVPPGARLRGMESETQLFIAPTLFGAAIGVGVALPFSIGHFYQKRRRAGMTGCFLAFMPLPFGLCLAELIAWMLEFHFD
jgi:cyanate permease